MKKLLFVASVAVAVASCTKSNTLTIKGSVADSTLNSQMVYLSDYNTDNAIDSCTVADGKFTLKSNTDSIAIVRVDLGRMYANILAESGTVNVELGRPSVISGTPLNDLLNTFNNEVNQLRDIISPKFEAMVADSTLTNEDKEAKYTELMNEYNSKNNELINKNLKGHETDLLGLYIIWGKLQERNLSVAQIDSLIVVGGKLAADFKPFASMRQAALNKEMTVAGKMFIDFDAVNPDGTPAKLSDYVGKGKYVLADFWASWCGPCKAEIPNLKQIYETYKDKDLVVLGVNVWDKKDGFEKSIQEFGMTWPQICDFDNNAATDTYGVDGIPQIILFAPDGTIVARDLRGEDMKNKVDSLLKK